MGFQFLPSRGGWPQATPNISKSVDGSKSITSSEESTDKASKSRPKKLLSKLTKRVSSKIPATPANTAPTATRTPATTLMPNGPTPGTSLMPNGTPIDLQFHDSVTHISVSHSTLTEQERIRQQLFYEEEGVEVTAQFQKPSSPSSSKRRSKSKHKEKNEDSSLMSRMISIRRSPKKKHREPERPSTPPVESDPVQHFPAVAKAVAQAKEEQIKRTASLEEQIKRTASLASASSESHDSTVVTQDSTQLKAKKRSNKPKKKIFDDKPFDEPGEVENATDDEDDEGMTEILDQDEPLQRGAASAAPLPPTSKPATCSTVDLPSCAVPACNPPDPQQLLDAFNCGGDDFTEFSGSAMAHTTQRSCRLVDAFYDNSCWTYQEATIQNRPFYDEAFAQKFLKDITEDGINLLWHLPPDNDDEMSEIVKNTSSVNWSGCSVVMKIKPGSCYSTNDVEPKLVWTTLGGGTNNEKVARCLVPLLKIQSVATFRETICDRDQAGDEIKEEEFTDTTSGVNLSRLEDAEEEDVCLFSITTEEGDVQVFEASTPRERDLFVAGLKNVIARLSFHVIVGDAGASSELYHEGEQEIPMGELPSIASPVKNMDRLAHSLMD